MTLYYSVWILLCLKVKIHCAGNIVLAKLSSIMSRIWGRICSHGCSHSQNHTAGMIWRDTVPNRGDTDKNHHGTTFLMPVSVPHHLSRKFCVSCTWALQCCQNITFPTPLLFTFCIHSFIHSFIHGNTQVFHKVLYAVSNALQCPILWSGYHWHYSITVILSFPLQISYMKRMLTHSFVNVFTVTSPYCNTT
jgi:hypothetical protein